MTSSHTPHFTRAGAATVFPHNISFYFPGVGRDGGEANMRGYLDEFYIFNKTLKDMEIKDLISKCTGEKSSVIMHLAFEKDTGNVTLDSSGLKNDASVLGLTPMVTTLGKYHASNLLIF